MCYSCVCACVLYDVCYVCHDAQERISPCPSPRCSLCLMRSAAACPMAQVLRDEGVTTRGDAVLQLLLKTYP